MLNVYCLKGSKKTCTGRIREMVEQKNGENIQKYTTTVGVIDDDFGFIDCDDCRNNLLNELLSPHLSYSP